MPPSNNLLQERQRSASSPYHRSPNCQLRMSRHYRSYPAQALSDTWLTASSRNVVKMSKEHGREDITVDTLSTPPVHVQPAPLSRRIAASLIDNLILGFVFLIFLYTSGKDLMHLTEVSNYSYYSALALLALSSFLYYSILEGLRATTIGKSILKLTVVQRNGEVCSFEAALKRNLLRYVDWLPILYFVGTIAVMTSSDGQKIGDRLAGTIVTRTPEKDPNPPPAPFLFHSACGRL